MVSTEYTNMLINYFKMLKSNILVCVFQCYTHALLFKLKQYDIMAFYSFVEILFMCSWCLKEICSLRLFLSRVRCWQ